MGELNDSSACNSNNQSPIDFKSRSIELQKELHKERAKINKLECDIFELNDRIKVLTRDLSAVVNSRIWKATGIIRQALLWLRRMFGMILLRYQHPALNPSSNLVRSDDDVWFAKDGDPNFDVTLSGMSLTCGWYRFKLFNIGENVREQAVVYFDYGVGYSEDNVLRFSSFENQTSTIVNIKQPVCGLRLDPVSHKCDFKFQSLGVRPASHLEVVFFYAKHYLNRQKKTGTGVIEAIRLKVKQLGGWKNLRLSALLGHVASFDMTRSFGAKEAIIVQDYKEWVDRHELPYLKEKYSHVRSRFCHLITVTFVKEHTEITPFPQKESGIHVLAIHSESFSVSETGNVIHVHYKRYEQLLRYLLDLPLNQNNQYYCFISQPVEIGPYITDAINVALSSARTNVDLLYFDHDSVNGDGERYNSNFKPAWDREMYLSSQYIGPVCVFSKGLVEQALEVLVPLQLDDPIANIIVPLIDKLNANNALRLPEIHYHLHEGCEFKKPIDEELLAWYLPSYEVRNLERGVTGVVPVYPLDEPSVSIIIPTKDQSTLLKQCVDSLLEKTTYSNYELIIVDNGTTEVDALDYLKGLNKKENISIIRDESPFNYSSLNNKAVARSKADIIILLNNDVEVISRNWIQELVCYASNAGVGCVGAKLYYPDNTIQHAGVVLGVHGVGSHCQRLLGGNSAGYNGRLQTPQQYSAVTAACMAVRREIFIEVGGLNQYDLKVAFNDVDFCLKLLESGYRNVWTPFAELYHHESVSRGDDTDKIQAARLAQEASYIIQRWGRLLDNDPAYNPNLSLSSTGFELSTRYLLKPVFSSAQQNVNPCEDPYFNESNIERVNAVKSRDVTARCIPKRRSSGLSIIILTLEKYELISGLLHSLVLAQKKLKEERNLDVEVIVGDTGSRDHRVGELYRELADNIILVTDLTYQFSKCNNTLYKNYSSRETVLFLNNDIIFDDAANALLSMYDHLQANDEIGVVGTYMLYPTKKLQHGGVDIYGEGQNKGLCFHPGHNMPFSYPKVGYSKICPAVTGACLMMAASLFEDCDLFDESFEVEAQDIDLCLKASRCGRQSSILYVGEIIHFENATRNKGEFNLKDRSRFLRKWLKYNEMMFDGG